MSEDCLALRVVALSGADGLELQTLPEAAGDGEVLVDVRAVGIGYSTLLRALGKYQERTDPPYTLDGEIAGIVLDAPASSELRPGERIVAPSARGFAAARVRVPASAALRLPEHLSFAQGACLRNFETALFALQVRGRVQPGDRILVHGAGG